MPPLYRMPIAYLVGAVVAAAVGLRALASRERSAPVASAPTEVSVVSRDEAAEPDTPVAEIEDDAILRTPEGLRRKVLVKDLDLACRSDPVGGLPIGPPLDYFSIQYVYGETPPGPASMVLVGDAEGPPRGWVPAGSVLEWDTRLMAKPVPSAERPPLRIYRDKACVGAILARGRCPEHGEACPIEGEEGPSGQDDSSPSAGLPILRSEVLSGPDGTRRTAFEVASLVRDQAPPPRPKAPSPDLQPYLKRIDVAFAIDTTGSMKASIDAARDLAETLVAETSRRYADVTLRLALVEYRDAAPSYRFRARVVTTFTNAVRFREALATLEASSVRDGSIDEAVFEGVAAALPAAEGERRGERQHLDWPSGWAGDLATKLLVLVGDAPDHARDLRRAGELASLARAHGISIATVLIDRPDLFRGDERARYLAQWRTLAEGSYRPLDRTRGFEGPIPPIQVALGGGEAIAPRLQALIDDRVESARDRAALAAAEAENRLEEYVTGRGLTLRQIHPVLVDLHRGEPDPSPRPDPRSSGRRAPSVRRGWIAEPGEGPPLVTVEVLMSRAELDALIGELTALQQASQGSARDLSDLILIGTAAASGETAFLASDRGAQTFADFLRRRRELPPAGPDSLLRRTQADLLQADAATRAALDARLGEAIDRLIRRRNDDDWNDPRRLIEGMALVPYDILDF